MMYCCYLELVVCQNMIKEVRIYLHDNSVEYEILYDWNKSLVCLELLVSVLSYPVSACCCVLQDVGSKLLIGAYQSHPMHVIYNF